MNNYREYILGKSAEEYIRQQISNGGKQLSTICLNSGKLSNAQIRAYLPDDFDSSQIKEYQYGGVANLGYTSLWIDEKVKLFLSETEHNLVIYEHAAALPNDPWLRKVEIKPFALKDEVYFAVSSSQGADISYIKKIRELAATAWLSIGLMINLSEDYTIKIQNPNDRVLSDLASNVKNIFVSVFDGEGYLLAEI